MSSDERRQSPAESAADVLDVHILDIAASLEALLRGVREIQRGALRLRGVVPSDPNADAAKQIQERVRGMLKECDELRDAVESAAETADALMRTRS